MLYVHLKHSSLTKHGILIGCNGASLPWQQFELPQGFLTLTFFLAFKLLQSKEFLPYTFKRLILEHNHELPPILPAKFKDRTIRIKAIQDDHNLQPGEIFLDLFSQSTRCLELTVLFIAAGVSFHIIKKFAGQWQHNALMEYERSLKTGAVILSPTTR